MHPREPVPFRVSSASDVRTLNQNMRQGADLAGDPFKTSVSVDVSPLSLTLNDRQLGLAAAFAATVQRMAARSRDNTAAAATEAAAQAVAEAVAEGGPGAPASPPHGRPWDLPTLPMASTPVTVPVLSGHASPLGSGGVVGASPGSEMLSPGSAVRPTRPETKALGVFGRVWDFMIDEASYIDGADSSKWIAHAGACLCCRAELIVCPLTAGLTLHHSVCPCSHGLAHCAVPAIARGLAGGGQPPADARGAGVPATADRSAAERGAGPATVAAQPRQHRQPGERRLQPGAASRGGCLSRGRCGGRWRRTAHWQHAVAAVGCAGAAAQRDVAGAGNATAAGAVGGSGGGGRG